MATGSNKVLQHLRRVLRPPDGGPTDGQLLARFIATRDEASFAALFHRHGPMVWRVCLRVLGHVQDAEDTFQATFLVLARRAVSVVKRESVGSFLYGVAYRTALEAKAINARRRSREKQVENMPQPEVMPAEARDWRRWLDHELNLLPETYRAVIVACDLEGRPRKEAARLLGLSEGTLSSRLARGRRLLAKRLSRHGLPLSAGALAVALPEATAPAPPTSLLPATVKLAALVAAGELSAVPTSVGILMKGVFQTMLLTKLKLAVGAVMVVVALGATGLAYRASGQPAPAPAVKGGSRPPTELDVLRQEVELLKLKVELVQEKLRAQEAELRALRGRAGAGGRPSSAAGPQRAGTGRDPEDRPHPPLPPPPGLPPLPPPAGPQGNGPPTAPPDPTRPDFSPPPGGRTLPDTGHFRDGEPSVAPHRGRTTGTDTLQQVEDALKTLREARDDESRRKAMDALEKALRELRRQQKKQEGSRN